MFDKIFAWTDKYGCGIMLDAGAFMSLSLGIDLWLTALDGHHPFAMQGAIITLMMSATIFYTSGIEGYEGYDD